MRSFLLFLLGTLVVAASPALAQPVGAALPKGPRELLADGRNAYAYGDYKLVIESLQPLVGQEQNLLTDAEEIVEAYELLGLSYFYLDLKDDARTTFERLVLYRPEKRLNPVQVPPPAVAFYDAIRTELGEEIRKRQEAIERRKREEAEKRRKDSTVQVIVDRRRNSRLVAALPLGIGQFQNGDDLLGGLFLGTELVAVALSATFYLAVESLRQSDGRYAKQDVDQARDLRTAQLVAGGTAVALMAGGVVHALLTFKDEVVVKETTIQPTVQPTVTPAGAGLFFQFSF